RSSSLTPSMARSMVAAATSVGAVGHVVSFPMVSLTGQRRNDEDVLRLTNSWRIPMATMVAPVAYIAAVGGQDMANAAADGYVLMGETSAEVRGAKVGDVMTLSTRVGRYENFSGHGDWNVIFEICHCCMESKALSYWQSISAAYIVGSRKSRRHIGNCNNEEVAGRTDLQTNDGKFHVGRRKVGDKEHRVEKGVSRNQSGK
ncbi:MAG: hypothetical protein RI898_1290, partial [Actinomycetota bacterium]